MAKSITILHEDTEYTLEFTRKSIETMERQGFVAKDLATRPVSTLPVLFAGAFLAHHKFLKKEVIDTIFKKLSNKDDLIEKLVEMYNDPLETLMTDSEDTSGNVTWGANW